MKPFQYLRPSKLKAAIEMVSGDPQARYIAGGTNLIDLMKRGIVAPEKLVDINHLPLKKIEYKTGVLRIGALALNSEVAAHETVLQKHPLLAQALDSGASGQLRNMATVGGNILQKTRCTYFYDTALPCNKREPESGCSALEGINRLHAIFGTETENPAKTCIAVHPSDMCVALAALDADVLLSGPGGERRIKIADLHRLPGANPELDTNLERGELITAVEIRDNAFARNSHYLKVRDRASYAFAIVSVAAALDIDNGQIRSARLAMGGVAHKPWRLIAAEKSLEGQPVTESSFRKAAEVAMVGARGFGQNDFKLKLAPNAIVQALLTAAGIE
ncbi:Aldehyde oxidoreductase FAD-binding subunit PaoB [Dyadobacter sp. CECT 9623]|uniref:Aldehyde oxidoreductase FAD-binding subunit PaoB n=1 Tax=Dyadobacter linearis TaxID=2823330 RepID=A0ABN7RFX5_9BACT|nr:xanthine dehydrogenase family protein subunit M [Dyadobacter sp. CECT 9623]CAG5072407.1 Aldehyde oxidoreductase FAD-binding subunit PaoB [Dyadobacter sp. CECT 9623]